MNLRPTFQAQNPAISGFPLGWASCTCFAGAMAAAFDQGQSFVMSGGAVRKLTGDTLGGTTLAQVDSALLRGWDVNLSTTYRLPWTKFAAAINAGKAGVLQGWYGPISDSRFDAGGGFRGNHAVTVLPGWIVMDPLADGRRSGIYRYHAEQYPQYLLRDFAGKLNLGGSRYTPLGSGLVYCALTRDRSKTWLVTVRPIGTAKVRRYTRHQVVAGVARMDLREVRETAGFQLPCSAPKSYVTNTGTRISLVQIQKAGSRMDGWFLSSGYSSEV